ncbi:TetR family transcriptional regulator [Acidimicrobiaceae bacterium USS-CC1]|uniref:TetR family transcriptional regulator n=1 Tax=Acidiferrimicrobium australe TaxID=2664430 RepID=A0ABW9QTA7_9ACTN|nr:TetR family transcriptional regulator [Acidiferrimicrobium australe]
MPAGSVAAVADVDGRVARRRRNREAVVEAALNLLEEGVLDPSVEQITERSGVSPRSVFRYFESLDEMRSAVLRRNEDRMKEWLAPVPAGGSLEQRVVHLVSGRVAMFDRVAGVARAARLREYQVPGIAADLARVREALRAQALGAVEPELRAKDEAAASETGAAIDVLLSFESWDLCTRVQGMAADQVRRVWGRALVGLLAAQPANAAAGGGAR